MDLGFSGTWDHASWSCTGFATCEKELDFSELQCPHLGNEATQTWWSQPRTQTLRVWFHCLMVGETEPWELKCLAHCDVIRNFHDRGQRPGALTSPRTFPSPPTALQMQEEFVTFCSPRGAGGAVGSWVLSPHFHIFVCFCFCLHLLNCHKMCMLWTSPFSPERKQNCMTHPFFMINCQDHELVTVHPGLRAPPGTPVTSLSLRDGPGAGGWGSGGLPPSLPESAWAQTIFPPGRSALINISSLLVSGSKAGSIKIHWPFDTKAYKSCEFWYVKRKTLVYDSCEFW